MTGSEIKDLNTGIRSGREMDDTIFYVLLNLAKASFERRRPWRKLVKKDTSNSSSASTTYATAFPMPSGFIMTLPRRTLKLVSGIQYLELEEVLYERWDEYKNTPGYFTIDHMNSQYYISTTVPSAYTHNFFFISTSADLDAAGTWVFPAEFHPALAFDVAAMDELGIDYDDINARQGNANALRAELIARSAIKWDDTLVRGALGI